MISDIHKQELATKFIFKSKFDSSELNTLNIQELFFLIASCDKFRNEEGFDDEVLLDRIELFKEQAKEVLRNLEKLYVLYDDATSYPFYDENDSVELYTEKEYANIALEFYNVKQYRKLRVVSFNNNELSSLFGDIYRLGFKSILVDNGQFFYKFDRDELISYKFENDDKPPHMSQLLMEACIKFFSQVRWGANYKGKEEVLSKYQAKMFEEINSAEYLIPIKRSATEGNEKNELIVYCAKIEDKQNGLFYLPIFSDWIEFEKVYNKEEYESLLMKFDDAYQLLDKNNYDGILLNANGINFQMNSNLIQAIRNSNA